MESSRHRRHTCRYLGVGGNMERREIQKATRTLMKLRLEKLVMAEDLVGQLEIFL